MIFSNKMVFFLSNLEKLEYRKYNIVLILLFKIAKLVLSLSFPHTPLLKTPKFFRALFFGARHTQKKHTHTKTKTTTKPQKPTTHKNNNNKNNNNSNSNSDDNNLHRCAGWSRSVALGGEPEIEVPTLTGRRRPLSRSC